LRYARLRERGCRVRSGGRALARFRQGAGRLAQARLLAVRTEAAGRRAADSWSTHRALPGYRGGEARAGSHPANHRRAAVTAAPEARVKITEIFLSVQGEAATVGFPTVFVRLTGCPLRCVYCDTAYAFHGGEWWTLDAVLAEVTAHGVRHVCVTGG